MIAKVDDWEEQARAQRSLERRQSDARIGRFKALADFDWSWAKQCDRAAIEALMTLEFMTQSVNVVLRGNNGVGKSMLAKNVAHQALVRGYTTQELERCNLLARAVALIYNWWSWYVRLAHPATRLEVITSRPLLFAGVARLTQHAGQSRLLLTLTHAAGDLIKSMVANARKGLDTNLATAPQLTKRELWMALVRYIVEKLPPPNQKTTFNLR